MTARDFLAAPVLTLAAVVFIPAVVSGIIFLSSAFMACAVADVAKQISGREPDLLKEFFEKINGKA